MSLKILVGSSFFVGIIQKRGEGKRKYGEEANKIIERLSIKKYRGYKQKAEGN